MKDDIIQVDKSFSISPRKEKQKNIGRTIAYLVKKAFLIMLTIFIGVLITVILVNSSIDFGSYKSQPQLDKAIRSGISRAVRNYQITHFGFYSIANEEKDAILDDLRIELEDKSGLNEPFLIKTSIYTLNALKFDWGQLTVGTVKPINALAQGHTGFSLNELLQQYLAMTLLLVVSAYLLIFVLGLPLALHLSQNYNKFFDKIVSFLAPISSVPSWVIGIILISIFAVELRILPIGGTFDTYPPETKIGYIPILLKHMALPVTAIFLSLFFQLVYSWRTIFVTFGNEDYVELGKAAGLKPKSIRKKYILKPTLPYVITSFSLMLVSFWQMTMALEVIFQWRGIGWLYVNVGLPNFWGENMYPGELLIALQLVVLFAYLLGMVVFILDIVYVLVDPRIRVNQNQPLLKTSMMSRRMRIRRKTSAISGMRRIPKGFLLKNQEKVRNKPDISSAIRTFKTGIKWKFIGSGKFLKEVFKFPSAIFGFSIIILLIIGSLYAVIGLPYNKIGNDWGGAVLSGKPLLPKIAQPAWTNIFRKDDLLSNFILNSNDGNVRRTEIINPDGTKQISLKFTFDYDFADFPSEMMLYLTGTYDQKTPFVGMTWTTPDGRVFDLGGVAVGEEKLYIFDEHIPAKRIVAKNENWQEWFNFTRIFPTPFHYVLFADPTENTPIPVKGTYQLQIDGITFEAGGDINAELVALGQVYGIAGTDYLRRDLSIPLFWGMPFALIIGLLGSLSTTIFSMILAATGVWFGGWVDDLVQRLTDVNLVLPLLAICVLAVAYLGINIWVILIVIVLLNVFGTPTKNFRSAFLQIKDAPYIESAKAYGASNRRIIMKYMVPKIIPVLVPQLIILIPSMVFLEATLGLFNINSGLPTWGNIIFQALTKGALYGSRYWVLEPLALILLTGVAFALFGTALERILNPKLLEK
ncbi:MAG: ABC transporter permease subunit [Anaerolineaceae bacterium]|nr:ABC transporter permease subunit [Anaerolineaceae bacterium]